jgi:hypothetical protein
MPTVTLHSGLFNSKTTTEPATKVPIHAHQPTNSALPKLMGANILGFIGDDERSPACTFRGRHHFTAVLREEWMEPRVEVALSFCPLPFPGRVSRRPWADPPAHPATL